MNATCKVSTFHIGNVVNADAYRKSAEIVPFPMKRGLPAASLEFADAARAMIWAVWPTRSQHETCIQAARCLHVSDDTIDRILSKATKKIDAELLFRVLGFYQAKFDKPFAFGGGVGVCICEVRE